jgi:hypothetical protein
MLVALTIWRDGLGERLHRRDNVDDLERACARS